MTCSGSAPGGASKDLGEAGQVGEEDKQVCHLHSIQKSVKSESPRDVWSVSSILEMLRG